MGRKKNVKKIVLRFAELLSKEIRVRKIILFGSYASGHHRRHSDIDIAVISPHFGKENEMKEMASLLKKAHEIDIDLEPHPFTPKEFRNPPKSSFAHEILKTGKVLYSA